MNKVVAFSSCTAHAPSIERVAIPGTAKKVGLRRGKITSACTMCSMHCTVLAGGCPVLGT